MKTAILRRNGPPSKKVTFGTLTEGSFRCRTVEKPWRNNKQMVSCIPAREKEYLVEWRKSPKYGWCYRVMRVKGRYHILFHPANWPFQLKGCIAPGRAVMKMRVGKTDKFQRGVTSSVNTTRKLVAHFKKKPFRLKIVNSWEEPCKV